MNQKFKGLMYSWKITEDAVIYGGLFKSKIYLKEIGNIEFSRAVPPKSEGEIALGHMRLFRLTEKENKAHIDKFNGNIVMDEKGILISYRYEQQDDVVKAVFHMVKNSRMDEDDKVRVINYVLAEVAGEHARYYEEMPSTLDAIYSGSSGRKDASVVGRAVVGGIIAGPTGAVVGALSAVDKNNKNKNKENN